LSGEGARLPESADRRVDDARICRVHRLIAQAEPRRHAGEEVLDEHVGAARKLEREPRALRLLEVHRDPALVAIDGGEGGAHLPGPAQRAQIIAAPRPLELDDVRAEVAEECGAVRSRDDAGEIEDANALEHGSPSWRGGAIPSRTESGDVGR